MKVSLRLPGVSGGWKRSLAAGGLVGEVLGAGASGEGSLAGLDDAISRLTAAGER